MRGVSYRIIATTLGIFSIDGNRASVTIPIGATVTVIGGPLNGNRLVDVMWGGTELMMFTQDLRDRAEPVLGTALLGSRRGSCRLAHSRMAAASRY
jgi:hypothetical protein